MSIRAYDRFTGEALGSAERELLRLRGQPVVMIGPLADRLVHLGDASAKRVTIDCGVECFDADCPPAETPIPCCEPRHRRSSRSGTCWALTLGISLEILHVAASKVKLSATALNDDWMTRLATDETQRLLDVGVQVRPVATVEAVRSHVAAHPVVVVVVSTRVRNSLDRLIHGAIAVGTKAAWTIATLVLPISEQGEQA